MSEARLIPSEWLCKIGIHDWDKWSEEADTDWAKFTHEGKIIPGSEFKKYHQTRACKDCNKIGKRLIQSGNG